MRPCECPRGYWYLLPILLIEKSNYHNFMWVLEDTQNHEITLLGCLTTRKFVCWLTSLSVSLCNVYFKRLDLTVFFHEFLILYSVTDSTRMLTTQGNNGLSLLEMDQEVLPTLLPSKVTEVEGCIRMYEEIHRLKGKVK